MTNQILHIADVKVGKVQGNSMIYRQLRPPSQYAELAGKKANIFEISWQEGDLTFIIRFDNQDNVVAYHGDTQVCCVANGREVPVKPCRGFDSGSNPNSGAPFLRLFGERGLLILGKECKLHPKPNHTNMSDLVLLFTQEYLHRHLTPRSDGLVRKTVTWLKKAAERLWNSMRGTMSVTAVRCLCDCVLAKY